MSVRVVCDSSCDLPAEVVEELGIEMVPLTVRFGEEEFVDRIDLTPQEFWARCRASAVLPETAAPSPGAFEVAYRRLAEAGCEGIVCVTISSKLSATGQAAQIGAKAVEELPVRVIDSRSATLGQGMIALGAARMGAEGRGLDEIVEAAEDMIARTRVYGALDTLENLKKGGRVGGARAFIGSVLSLKPIIQVRDGAVEAESKQRTRSRALRYLVEKVRSEPSIDNLALMHGDAPDVGELLDLLDPVYPRDRIIVGDLGAVIGAHAGPRTIGVAYQVGA